MSNNSQIVKVCEIPQEQYPYTDSNFGLTFETILKNGTLSHIKGIKSLYDQGLFSNGRKIKATKGFFIGLNDECDIREDFKKAFNDNNFYLFPSFYKNYKFTINKQDYILNIFGNGKIYINPIPFKTNYNKPKVLYAKDSYYDDGTFRIYGEKYYYDDFQSYKDVLQLIVLVNNYLLILFSSEIEVDGIFVCNENFNLSVFQADEIFMMCGAKEIIEKGKIILYEAKSGNDLIGLLNQILRHYHFLEKYFNLFKKYNINNFIYIGFVRDKEKIIIDDKMLIEFQKIPIPVVILRFVDKLFGENVFHDNIEISEICEIKYLAKENNENIQIIDSKISHGFNEITHKLYMNDTYFDKFTQNFNNVDLKFKNVEQSLLDIKQNVAQKFNDVDKRFNNAEKNFKNVDQKFINIGQNVDHRFNNVSQRFNNVDQSLEGISQNVAHRFNDFGHNVDQRFNNVTQRFNNVDQKFNNIGQDVDNRFNDVSQRFNNVDTKLDKMNLMLNQEINALKNLIISFHRPKNEAIGNSSINTNNNNDNTKNGKIFTPSNDL